MVSVLAHHHALLAHRFCRFVRSQRRDVDEKARLRVNPPRVDNIQLVGNGVVCVVRIHFEHVVPTVGDAG